MELAPETASRYVHLAFRQMLAVVDRLGDAKVNERPISSRTNAVAPLVVHCCGLAEFWLGHVGLGRDSDRDRDSEFTATATVEELHTAVDVALRQIDADLAALEAGAESPHAAHRAALFGEEDRSDAALVLHVIEELFQHLGHCEIVVDALAPT
ncbi:MAG: DUF664 domain-containing protein [Acidimicrobiales bacterium]